MPESWGSWWVPDDRGQPRIAVDDRTYREGGHSVKIQNTDILTPKEPGQGIRITLDHSIDENRLKPNTDYLLTYYIKLEGVTPVCRGHQMGAFIYISTTDGEHTMLNECQYTGDIPWTKQGLRYKTPQAIGFKDGKLKPHLWFCLCNSKGTVWFDDVRLREVEAGEGTK